MKEEEIVDKSSVRLADESNSKRVDDSRVNDTQEYSTQSRLVKNILIGQAEQLAAQVNQLFVNKFSVHFLYFLFIYLLCPSYFKLL
jgi:hypothetical protein